MQCFYARPGSISHKCLASKTLAPAALTKERDGIAKKKKIIDAALEGVEKEIASFQKEKQFSMNDIEMVLSLRMNQVLLTIPSVRQD